MMFRTRSRYVSRVFIARSAQHRGQRQSRVRNGVTTGRTGRFLISLRQRCLRTQSNDTMNHDIREGDCQFAPVAPQDAVEITEGRIKMFALVRDSDLVVEPMCTLL